MFTHFFIDRPILSSVISILIVLGGLVAMSIAPIEQYPDMAPPQVSVDARYPGATAEVIANQVAAPIETQINGVDNLLYFYSTSSSSGNVTINVFFKPGSNPDINQVNVQNRVSQATAQLPQAVVQQGITVDKKSSSIMMVISIYSPDDRYDATYLDNYTNLYVLEELKRVPGANRSVVLGLPDIAMRVWLRPDRLAQLGISVQEVADQTEIFFTLDTLHYLQKGGRIGRVQAMAGSLLNLKPVITVDKGPGTYVTVAKGRSMSKSIALIADQVQEKMKDRPAWVHVLHTNSLAMAQQLADLVTQRMKAAKITAGQIVPVLGVHVGPGCVGAVCGPLDVLDE